jgi:preprotein translocase subunit SecY
MSSALAQGKMMASGGGLAELRSRLLFVLLAIVVYRIGSHIPIPGIDPERLQLLFSQNQGGILDLVNMFGGGALERMSIFHRPLLPNCLLQPLHRCSS